MQCFLQEPSAIWRIGEIQDSSMVWTDIAMENSCSCFSLWSDQEKINRLPGNRAETHEGKTCETLGNGYKGDYEINYRTIFESVHLLYQHYQNWLFHSSEKVNVRNCKIKNSDIPKEWPSRFAPNGKIISICCTPYFCHSCLVYERTLLVSVQVT